jgi:RNA polymerase sigma factor (sigma-70 family)
MSEPSRFPTTEPEIASDGTMDWGATLAVHEHWLRRVVASRLGEPQAVDEVMQDVALAAVAQRSPLHNPARAAVWLYRLAVRHVLIHRRKSGRQRSLVDRYAARRGPGAVDTAPSPLAWLVQDERQKLVQDALRRLPPRDAEILVLKHAEGFTARELADRLGVAVATVETRLHRARHRLRVELAELSTEFEASNHDRP